MRVRLPALDAPRTYVFIISIKRIYRESICFMHIVLFIFHNNSKVSSSY